MWKAGKRCGGLAGLAFGGLLIAAVVAGGPPQARADSGKKDLGAAIGAFFAKAAKDLAAGVKTIGDALKTAFDKAKKVVGEIAEAIENILPKGLMAALKKFRKQIEVAREKGKKIIAWAKQQRSLIAERVRRLTHDKHSTLHALADKWRELVTKRDDRVAIRKAIFAALSGKVTKEVRASLKNIARKLGLGPKKGACLSRRAEVAACKGGGEPGPAAAAPAAGSGELHSSRPMKSIAFTVGASAAAVAGLDAQLGVAFDIDGTGEVKGFASLSAVAGVSIGLGFGLRMTVSPENVSGLTGWGLGLTISAGEVVEGSVGFDWSVDLKDFKNTFKHSPAFAVGLGVGVGATPASGTLGFGWNMTFPPKDGETGLPFATPNAKASGQR